MKTQELLVISLGAALLTACGSEPSPVLLGRVGADSIRQALTLEGHQTAAVERLELEINGDLRSIPIDEDASFAVQDLPSGEIEIRVAVEGITGTIVLDDVQPGEVIEVDVSAGPGRLEIRVLRRDPAVEEPVEPSENGEVVIRGNHVVHHLEPGTYERVVVEGNHVTLIGPDYYGCREGGRAIVLGDLIIRGNDVRVVNLEVRGRTSVEGNHARIYRSCELEHDDDEDSED